MSAFADAMREQIRKGYTFTEEGDPGNWVLQTLIASILEIERYHRFTTASRLLEEVLQAFQRYSRTTSDRYGNGPWPMFIAVAELHREGALRLCENVVRFEIDGLKPKAWTE